jgi:hypothetical protein
MAVWSPRVFRKLARAHLLRQVIRRDRRAFFALSHALPMPIQVGEPVQCPGLILPLRVTVTVHGEGDGRVPRQSLSGLGMNPALGEVRDEGVPKSVEVDHPALGVAVGNASGLQVNAKDASQVLPLWELEDRLVQRALRQKLAQR